MSSAQLEKTTRPGSPPPALESKGLRKSYGQRKRRFEAVSDVSLKLEPGEVLAFLGPNGAGKTTTIKMIAGLIRPDAGWVKIAGLNPHHQPEALSGIGAVLEGNRNLYWRLTALENLEYFGVLRKMPRKQARSRGLSLLETFGLLEKRKEPVQNLSRGMQQKIAIAVALIHQPQLLLLDEPTLGLDVEAGETVKAIVRQIASSGCAILLTTHQLNVAEALSDRVAIIQAGKIVTEQNTQDLIRQFSRRGAYRIEFEGTLTDQQRQAIISLGGSVKGHYIHFLPTAAGDERGQFGQSVTSLASPTLYKLFRILDPLPLVEVRQDRADLTDVFLQIVQQKAVLPQDTQQTQRLTHDCP
ncbi:MAG: ABC transporter ATP-binding protein [Cyanobacteria bacterium J06614_10]